MTANNFRILERRGDEPCEYRLDGFPCISMQLSACAAICVVVAAASSVLVVLVDAERERFEIHCVLVKRLKTPEEPGSP